MKKQIAIAMGLAVLSTGALASKARLEALGQDSYGSMFLDDSRNVTLNPAMLNFHKDFVTLEWGNTTAAGDAASTPRAEGGMFKASGNMIYGLYFGDESNTGNGLRGMSMPTGSVMESNNTSFYVAGDAGVQWGAKFTYHDFKDEQNGAGEISSSATRTSIGIISGDIEAFLTVGLSNAAENKGTNEEFKGKGSYQLGVTYGMNGIDYLLEVQSITAENEGGDKFTAQYTRIGAAKQYKLSDKANVWTSAWYKMDNTKCEWGAACAGGGFDTVGDQKNTYLPVSVALEVMAKDWLSLRGSVSQNFIGTTENDAGDKKTMTDTTAVTAGASLLFGDLTIDGMIGNTAPANDAGDNETVGTSTASGNGTLRTDSLMSRVSMTYKF